MLGLCDQYIIIYKHICKIDVMPISFRHMCSLEIILDQSTVKKCGFAFLFESSNTSVDTSPVTHDDTSPVTPDDTTDYSAMLDGMSLQEYAACDDDIETRLDEISTPATTPSENTAVTADGDEQEAGDDHEVPHPPITKLKALSHLRELEIFFLQQNVPHLRDAIVKIQSDTLARNPTTSKQTTLTNFFKRT